MIRTLLKGLLMGAADIVPGVSGGTMAFITGIYDRLITGIADVASALKIAGKGEMRTAVKMIDWVFFIPLALGIIVAMGIGSKVIPALITVFPGEVYGFFIGLILASAYIVYNHITEHTNTGVLLGLLGFTTGLFFALAPFFSTELTGSMAFVLGTIAISAMLLPGISGSYILLMFGQYETILKLLHAPDFRLFLFVGGIVVGILTFSHVLKWLLKKYHSNTFWFLLGIMLGALARPGRIATAEFSWVVVLLCCAGGILVLLVERLSQPS